jgi:hypothetical protein
MDQGTWVLMVIYVAIGTSLAMVDMIASNHGRKLTALSLGAAFIHYLSYVTFWPVHLYFELKEPPS